MALGESLISQMGNLYGHGYAFSVTGGDPKYRRRLANAEMAAATNAANQMQQAYDTSTANSTALQQASIGNTDSLRAANQQLSNLLGLGSGGMEQALATLQSTPGYQFAVQQANQALQKQMGAQGLGMSGNFANALSNQVQQMAAQNIYQQQVGNIGSYLKQQTDSAAQLAATEQARGSLLAGIQNQLGSASGFAAYNRIY